MTDGKLIDSVTAIDPHSGEEVKVAIYLLTTGAMVGVDESFLENTDNPIWSPYDLGDELNLG